MRNLFYEGLIENDTSKLLSVPKSDIHNHSTKGCRRTWLEERLNRHFPKPPDRFGGLEGMHEWFAASIKPYCSYYLTAPSKTRIYYFIRQGR